MASGGQNGDDRLRKEEIFALGAGKNPPPGMEWIRGHAGLKYRPDRLLKGCLGVLVLALDYYRWDEVDRAVEKTIRAELVRNACTAAGNSGDRVYAFAKVSLQ